MSWQTMASNPVQLPKITPGYLGPQTKFTEYGLSTVSHAEPVIYMQEDQAEVEVILGVPPKTRVTVKMISCERKKECTEYVLLRALGPNKLFLIRPPLPGFYKFQLYAIPPDEAGPQMLCVYNYLVHCPGQFGDKPFPKQYPMWKAGCYLHEPTSLPKGVQSQAVKFKLLIPNAKDVQIKVDEEWNPLEQTGPGWFEGIADFSLGYAQGSKAKVNCNFQGTNYQTLLEYSL